MKVRLPIEVLDVLAKLGKSGFDAYTVGGAVRDLIQKRMVDDWDFATNATPEEILKIFPEGISENIKFGTVMVPNELTKTPFDITTFRTEHGYSDARRPDKVKWGKNIEEDLKRRDFTIDAMAIEAVVGSHLSAVSQKNKSKTKRNLKDRGVDVELIDSYDGQKDLENKLIRAVGKPDERFSEDALRMMRAIRIGAELNFKIEEKTLTSINKNKKLIGKIARERVRDELLKLLASPHPYEGVVLFRETGLMQEVVPEMEKTFGVEQKSPGRHHIYDVGTHSLLSLKNCPSTDPIVRFATLIHDIGKPRTYKKLKNGVITFYNHELVSARIAKQIAQRLKFSKKQADKFWRLVRYHQFTVDEKQTDSAIRRFIRNVGLENVPDMLDLRVGDRLGGGARETSWRLEEFKKRLIEVQKQPFTVHDLKISGNDVMKELNLKPSPKVGEILDILYKEVVEKKLPNEKKELLVKLKEIK
jgi:putative nucleotidyltransferase with HDIG domain